MGPRLTGPGETPHFSGQVSGHLCTVVVDLGLHFQWVTQEWVQVGLDYATSAPGGQNSVPVTLSSLILLPSRAWNSALSLMEWIQDALA